MTEENISVSMKLSPKKTGRLYMELQEALSENKKLKHRVLVFENALLDSLDVIESVDAHSVREQNPTYKAIELLANA